VGGTIYNTHTLKPFKELGLDSQRVKKLASKLPVHFVNFAANLVHTRRALSILLSILIRSRFQAKPATLLIPIDSSFPF
jgi:transcriptional regulator of met regulon